MSAIASIACHTGFTACVSMAMTSVPPGHMMIPASSITSAELPVLWWATYRRIVPRLMAPTLVAVRMATFVGAARNIGNVALFSTTANRRCPSSSSTTSPRRSSRRPWSWRAWSWPSPWPGALVARFLGVRGGVGERQAGIVQWMRFHSFFTATGKARLM